MKAWLRWLEERTGAMAALKDCGDRPVPAGTRWIGLWPAAILFAFLVEAITGVALWMYYSPSAQTAWESVYYVQHHVLGGETLRAMHYHAGQVLLALIGLYILHMVFSGAYRAPREVVFWVAVLMGVVTLGLLLTGDLLAWTQRGYWSTNVRTKYLMLLPWIGEHAYKIAVGGPGIGHLTLTRFFALHAGVLSAAFAVLAWLHYRVSRRADAQEAPQPLSARWWPGQAVLGGVACLAVLGVIALFVSTGVELGAPRDPVLPYDAARPDWYFVCLYQFARFFPGSIELIPIFIVPGLLVVLFLAMPLVARKPWGHLVNRVVAVGLVVAAVLLTRASLVEDRDNPAHQASLAAENADAERVVELADGLGIPATGALTLLREDPKTQGPRLFKQQCASCHDYNGPENPILAETPSAPDLHDFASVAWLTGFFDLKQLTYAPAAEELGPTNRPKYFGNTKFKTGKMAQFLKDDLKTLKEEIDDGDKQFQKLIEALAAEAQRAPGTKAPEEIVALFDDFTCTSSGCHHFHGSGKLGAAPDLTGYGSREWVIGIVNDPTHARFYGAKNDRMPAYAPAGSPDKAVLTAKQVEMLADWMHGRWYKPEQP